jgi:hypothetical protein
VSCGKYYRIFFVLVVVVVFCVSPCCSRRSHSPRKRPTVARNQSALFALPIRRAASCHYRHRLASREGGMGRGERAGTLVPVSRCDWTRVCCGSWRRGGLGCVRVVGRRVLPQAGDEARVLSAHILRCAKDTAGTQSENRQVSFRGTIFFCFFLFCFVFVSIYFYYFLLRCILSVFLPLRR